MAKKKYKILVIDDDPEILDLVKMVLEKTGYTVSTAMSGKEGIEKLNKKKPDLILCDMMMEKIDSGITVAKEAKKTIPDVPVYLISNIGTATAYNVDINKLNLKGVFQKPVDMDLLLARVKEVLK